MPISAALDPQSRVFRTTLSGIVTLTDLSQHLATVRQLGAHQYPGLVDARGVHTLWFGRRDLAKFADELNNALAASGAAPRAVVVSDTVHFGMARMFATLVSGWIRVGVFDDMQAAEEWLTTTVAH
jgi:hypothetical protein